MIIKINHQSKRNTCKHIYKIFIFDFLGFWKIIINEIILATLSYNIKKKYMTFLLKN